MSSLNLLLEVVVLSILSGVSYVGEKDDLEFLVNTSVKSYLLEDAKRFMVKLLGSSCFLHSLTIAGMFFQMSVSFS